MDVAFEWDPRKAAANRRKHRVAFEEAARTLLVVSHAERDATIRPISARPATRRERGQYEEGE
jgi:uncharacterized DUF497 family protein